MRENQFYRIADTWEHHAGAEEAKREEEARVDERLRREHEEQERRQRLTDMRASLSDEALTALRHGAEDALAADGVDHTRLGYEVLVKLKMDELLEQACVLMPVSAGEDVPPRPGSVRI